MRNLQSRGFWLVKVGTRPRGSGLKQATSGSSFREIAGISSEGDDSLAPQRDLLLRILEPLRGPEGPTSWVLGGLGMRTPTLRS